MILFIDNYDSFTYNLVQFCGSVNPDIKVVRNDEITVDEIKKLAPSHIILSPGPGYPKDAGICEEVIKELAGQFPILGICLGHQAICEVYGATIAHAIKLMHGKKSDIIVGGRNFGLGSSREHAPLIIKMAGIDAIIARSFARIFYRNAINVGLAAIICPIEGLNEGDELQVRLNEGVLEDITTGAI